MQRGEKIAGDLQAVADLLDGAEGGLARLRQAARILERVAGDHDALAEALAANDRAILEDAAAEDGIDAEATALAFDPARPDADEPRLFDPRGRARKTPVTTKDLAAQTDEMSRTLARTHR